ncbi:MAG: nucleoside hydrolase [Actinomycetota bacterium]|nr:nucleoside hydrolase [Actinomycetota bacterium]
MDAPGRIHLDTDLGSDTDDLCALAMLFGWEGAEVVGITTNTDPGGIRSGYTKYALALAGRQSVPVRAGAEGSLASLFSPLVFPDYWPEPIEPRPGRPGEALELLEANAEAGATIVAVGPFTNLAMLEAARPGLLAGSNFVVMGGHMTTPRAGLPRWGVHDDFNVQQDRFAAATVFERCGPVVVPLAVTLEVSLRRAHLPRLREAGELGRLLADQGEMHARDNVHTELQQASSALPGDLLNFHYDPLACAVALGWDGVRIDEIGTDLDLREGRLWMKVAPDAPALRVVTEVDGPRFEEVWLEAVERASAPRAPAAG